MSRRNGSAAALKAPESATTVPELYRQARDEAAFAASALASACRDPEASREHIIRSADRALDAAGRLRGFAFLHVR